MGFRSEGAVFNFSILSSLLVSPLSMLLYYDELVSYSLAFTADFARFTFQVRNVERFPLPPTLHSALIATTTMSPAPIDPTAGTPAAPPVPLDCQNGTLGFFHTIERLKVSAHASTRCTVYSHSFV